MPAIGKALETAQKVRGYGNELRVTMENVRRQREQDRIAEEERAERQDALVLAAYDQWENDEWTQFHAPDSAKVAFTARRDEAAARLGVPTYGAFRDRKQMLIPAAMSQYQKRAAAGESKTALWHEMVGRFGEQNISDWMVDTDNQAEVQGLPTFTGLMPDGGYRMPDAGQRIPDGTGPEGEPGPLGDEMGPTAAARMPDGGERIPDGTRNGTDMTDGTDAGYRTPDAGRRMADAGYRMAEGRLSAEDAFYRMLEHYEPVQRSPRQEAEYQLKATVELSDWLRRDENRGMTPDNPALASWVESINRSRARTGLPPTTVESWLADAATSAGVSGRSDVYGDFRDTVYRLQLTPEAASEWWDAAFRARAGGAEMPPLDYRPTAGQALSAQGRVMSDETRSLTATLSALLKQQKEKRDAIEALAPGNTADAAKLSGEYRQIEQEIRSVTEQLLDADRRDMSAATQAGSGIQPAPIAEPPVAPGNSDVTKYRGFATDQGATIINPLVMRIGDKWAVIPGVATDNSRRVLDQAAAEAQYARNNNKHFGIYATEAGAQARAAGLRQAEAAAITSAGRTPMPAPGTLAPMPVPGTGAPTGGAPAPVTFPPGKQYKPPASGGAGGTGGKPEKSSMTQTAQGKALSWGLSELATIHRRADVEKFLNTPANFGTDENDKQILTYKGKVSAWYINQAAAKAAGRKFSTPKPAPPVPKLPDTVNSDIVTAISDAKADKQPWSEVADSLRMVLSKYADYSDKYTRDAAIDKMIRSFKTKYWDK